MNLKKLAGVCALLFNASAWAVEPFVVKDIRVEGIQRTEAGTVFSYLPLKVGDTLNDERATAALHALFTTGFFRDVQLLADRGVLVVRVQERPTLAAIELIGIKDIPSTQLQEGLKLSGLAEGRIFDKAMLEKAVQELKRQYIARGKYAVEVTTTVSDLERNRVAVKLDVIEGDPAKIRRINFVGNRHYSDEQLRDEMKLTTPGLLTWFTSNDQYSKPKLEADMEAIRSLYLNSGFMDFSIDSTQVSISADKKDIYITLNLTEGEPYTVTEVKAAGAKGVLSAEALRGMVDIQPGQVFSREALTATTDKIREEMGDRGYAFANVSAIPEVDKDKHTAAFTFMVDPMQRAYVRHINVTGNEKTKDEVIRREFRQMEGGWFSTSKIKKSKQRIDKLDFFSTVNVETQPVTGSNDQLDLNLSVEEKPTGSFQIGLGLSSGQGISLLGGISQTNLFGTGNALSAQVNTSKINQALSISFTNPYFTDDGISRGFDIFKRKTDTNSTAVSQFTTDSYGGGIRLGVPINDDESFQYGLSLENTTLGLTSQSPQRYIDYVNTFGATNRNVLGTIGWVRDTRDSAIYTTEGDSQRAFLEASLPVSGERFYKLTYGQQWYYPLSKNLTVRLNADLGIAGGYGGHGLPFFKNLYAGGAGSVRGFEFGSLGPRDSTDLALGGDRRVVGNAEVLFPVPGMESNKSVRLSTFLDAGAVYGKPTEVPATVGMRYSVGVGISWFSPVGPIQLSWAEPINKQTQDKVENFQFTFGSFF